MPDILDKLQEQEEVLNASNLKQSSKPVLPKTGHCYNCSEPVDHHFCDCDCRYDWEMRERQRRLKL